ncbi:MAG: undecaprenyldiphospho-muramoylpentapeptide beta-N-acetylglucosaminyltransferase [Clostridia bacterium]|nr:undecaprenyldiphospho-muramoylpentapeptide beta-N-acetylglucosaminyltransferase [Clostridia bacterium]
MRVLLTGGGTGGHVYPALAIAEMIKTNHPDSEIAFVGTEKGIENKLVPRAGYHLYHINIQGIHRSLSPSNFKTAYLVLTSPKKAKKIIEEFRPDLVIGTGGYVCWPLLRAASSMGIPTMVHESNALAGVAVRQLQKQVDVILTNFAETKEGLSRAGREKAIHVGNPLRTSLSTLSKEEARRKLGIDEKIGFVILSFGGSLGAQALNQAAAMLGRSFVATHKDVMQIHAGGTRAYEHAKATFDAYGLTEAPRTVLEEYLYDMPTYLAAADLVISRAGAMTLTEIASLGKPAILIPYPDATDNHQYKNAKVLADAGAAILVEEAKMTEEALCDAVERIYRSQEIRSAMREALRAFHTPDVERRIDSEICSLLRRKQVIVEKE